MTTGPNIIVNGNETIKDVYYGSQIIAQVYYGADLVFSHYPVQGTVFEKSVAGSYTFTPTVDGMYEFDIVGAGGGGAWSLYGDTKYVYYTNCSGGGGGYVHGYISLTKGTSYSLVVGSGGAKATGNYDQQASAGTASTGFGQTANGGGGAHANSVYWSAHEGGSGGSYTTTYEGHNGNAGTYSYGVVDTTVVYGGQSYFGGEYGRGGQAGNTTASNGAAGYIRIKYVGSVLFSKETAGSYSFTPDIDGLYEIRLVGAGGGGASGPDYEKYAWKSANAGGGSGGYIRARYRLTKGTNYPITVGKGGSGYGASFCGGGTGGTGGASTFSNLITCNGGTGGYAVWNHSSPIQTAGSGGTASATGYSSLITNTTGNNGSVQNGWATANGGASVYLQGAGGYGSAPNGATSGQDGLIQILYISS